MACRSSREGMPPKEDCFVGICGEIAEIRKGESVARIAVNQEKPSKGALTDGKKAF